MASILKVTICPKWLLAFQPSLLSCRLKERGKGKNEPLPSEWTPFEQPFLEDTQYLTHIPWKSFVYMPCLVAGENENRIFYSMQNKPS
jgi:hypothetical protein